MIINMFADYLFLTSFMLVSYWVLEEYWRLGFGGYVCGTCFLVGLLLRDFCGGGSNMSLIMAVIIIINASTSGQNSFTCTKGKTL